MTAVRKYKLFIAASLLAMYAFVATPVQWWHHHNATGTAVVHRGDVKHAVISKAISSNGESGCQICSHKYSTHNDDALVPFVSSLLIPAIKNGFYCVPVILTRSYTLPNKGPPSLS